MGCGASFPKFDLNQVANDLKQASKGAQEKAELAQARVKEVRENENAQKAAEVAQKLKEKYDEMQEEKEKENGKNGKEKDQVNDKPKDKAKDAKDGKKQAEDGGHAEAFQEVSSRQLSTSRSVRIDEQAPPLENARRVTAGSGRRGSREVSMRKIVTTFHEAILKDALLKEFFQGRDMQQLVSMQTDIVQLAFDADGDGNDDCMAAWNAHWTGLKDAGFTEAHLDHFLKSFAKTLEDLELPAERATRCVEAIEPIRRIFQSSGDEHAAAPHTVAPFLLTDEPDEQTKTPDVVEPFLLT